MGDLEVAIDELHDLGDRLRELSERLKKSDGKKSYGKDELAHDDVIDGMKEFKDNWDDNRDHLADKLKDLGDLATTTADEFTKADEDLAKELVKAIEGAE